jgi:hypothetical protein
VPSGAFSTHSVSFTVRVQASSSVARRASLDSGGAISTETGAFGTASEVSQGNESGKRFRLAAAGDR